MNNKKSNSKQNSNSKNNNSKPKKDYKITLGKKLKLARHKANITQAQLAEEVDVSIEHISNMERGTSYGSVELLIDICNTLNISADFIFDGSIERNLLTLDSIADDNLVESYLKLNPRNKRTLSTIALALANEQEQTNKYLKKA